MKEAERIARIYEETLSLTCSKFIDTIRTGGIEHFADKGLDKKILVNRRKLNRIRKRYLCDIMGGEAI